ncbi:MAG: site-specific tyrosine recombinase/integron integrase [Lachnoclostridium sp.]|nr:site-specific tyrosine recombinase/integron integrase [Lachnoclostridium sp.]
MRKEVLANQIINRMNGVLDEHQLEKLEQTLTIVLYGYNVELAKNELIEYDNYDQFLVEQYYAALKIEGKSIKTIERYFSQIKTMMEWIKKPLREITTEDLRYYLAMYQQKRKVSNTTLDGMRKCICAFFSWAEFSEYIEKSPARRIKGIKHDTVKEAALTSGEIEKAMLNCENNRNKAIISFMYETAARVSEVAAVSLSDINFQERTVVLHGKGNKDRVSMFTDKTMLYLEEYLRNRESDSNILFESAPGKQITGSGIQNMVRSVGEKSGIEHLHPHRFRVSRITHLVNRGMPLQDVQELVGHSDINTTQEYYRNALDNIKHTYRKAAQ